MPRQPKPARPSSQYLSAVLNDFNRFHREDAFWDYSCHKPDIADLPTLRRGLIDPEFAVVRAAAVSIGKLGPAAISAEADLFRAARRLETGETMPQAYCDCLDALISIGANPEACIELILGNFGHTNWGYVKSSMHGLQRIGTPKALDLLSRVIRFWWSDLNKSQRAYVEKQFPDTVGKGP